MNTLFWFAAGFCAYTYVVFPLILHWRARRRPELVVTAPDSWPSVSIVIAVHNEIANLPVKIASLQSLDYPSDRLQIVFVSDGSGDGSDTLLQQAKTAQPEWLVHHYEVPAGKPTALNIGVQRATGDILVFMDARQRISANAIKELVSWLQIESVGVVSGELVLAADDNYEAASIGLYWRYEKWIRQNESRLFSTTGATGALYAMHRSAYLPLPSNVLLDDFNTPVALLAAGKRTLFAPEAQVFDTAETNTAGEFRRKVRTLAGNFQSFRNMPWLFNPLRNPVWWQFISHKVFRLLVPYALIVALLASALGGTGFLRLAFIAQLAFYLLGVITMFGWFGENNRLMNFSKVFMQLNAAAVLGAIRYVTRTVNIRWKQT
jgi:cellulose synthase/poly-beta-1,6-N-acetylglucosamine synthase-like glycosyltransferase